MTPAALLPPIQKPPHDPTALILAAPYLWRSASADQLRIDRASNRIMLKETTLCRRSLVEAGGTFGGLVPPWNVAVASDGSVYLLDQSSAILKRFDPCECRFEPVPALGGIGNGPREFCNPGGIGICAGNLFVCDRENRRLSLFLLRGFALRGHWKPPQSAYEGPVQQLLTNPWKPFDVDFDSHGYVYVSDPVNQCIHRFSPRGVWLAPFRNLAGITHLAVDCHDRIYVVVGDQKTVKRLDRDGKIIEEISVDLEEVESKSLKAPKNDPFHFPPLPFAVDGKGRLHLGGLCPPSCCSDQRADAKEKEMAFGVFDQRGDPADALLQTRPKLEKEGVLISAALDSEMYRCVWHRVILDGEIPEGTTIEMETLTSEVVYSDREIKEMFDRQSHRVRLTPSRSRTHRADALVRSEPGRYLWLKLTFRGNGEASAALRGIEVEFPRISLRRYLPAVFGEEPTSADFTDRFLSLFDTTFRSIERTLDNLAGYFDPMSAPAERRGGKTDFLSWLASWVGITFDRQWPEEKRRRFLKQAGRLFPRRGTRKGLWLQLLLYLGIEPDAICCMDDAPKEQCSPPPRNCTPLLQQPCHWKPPALILEHFRLRRWLFLGQGRLHDRAMLWGNQIVNRTRLGAEQAQVGKARLIMRQDSVRDPFHQYAHQFTVYVPAKWNRSDAARKGLENLIKAESPAHTRFHIEYVEPRFRIGFQSMLGFNTAIGRWPQGVTLDATKLGQGSVLSTPPHVAGGPGFVVGKESTVGTTTQLH